MRASKNMIVLGMIALLAGCNAPPIKQWEAAMITYTEIVNQVADAKEKGKVSEDHVQEFKAAAKPVRAALDAWRDTISPNGGTQSEDLRDFAMRVLNTFKETYGRPTR